MGIAFNLVPGTRAVMPSAPSSAAASPASPVYGVVDLGTNNCRMLVATPGGDGFKVLSSFSRIVRLGEGLAETGRLAEAAMTRTVDALAVCAEKFRALGVDAVRAVSTEACRRAANADAFVARVAAETGIRLDVIAGEEEARLTLAGCAPLLADGPERVLLFDIGGGSTEIVWAKRADGGDIVIEDLLSLPDGVVTLTERAGAQALADGTADAVLAPLRDAFEAFDAKWAIADAIAAGGVRLLGTSGTVTTLAALKLGLRQYDRRCVDGAEVDRVSIEDTARAVRRMSVDARARNLCIGEKRADLVAAGIAVLDLILTLWPAPTLLVADRGIREGLLREMTAKDVP